jgi:hypothetical protein
MKPAWIAGLLALVACDDSGGTCSCPDEVAEGTFSVVGGTPDLGDEATADVGDDRVTVTWRDEQGRSWEVSYVVAEPPE